VRWARSSVVTLSDSAKSASASRSEHQAGFATPQESDRLPEGYLVYDYVIDGATCASGQQALNVRYEIVERVLNRIVPGAAGVYQRSLMTRFSRPRSG
jgi:hypothetical protein